jgi:hypothetical protein
MGPERAGMSDLGIRGAVAVVGNAFVYVLQPLEQARQMIGRSGKDATGAPATPWSPAVPTDLGQVNGLLFTATVMALSVLDAFASACQEISELPGQQKVYFERYDFIHSEVAWVQGYQASIAKLAFDGNGFFDYANRLKHERPWVGSLSMSERTGMVDVYDSSGMGYLYGVLVPLYTHIKGMVIRLGVQHSVHMPNFPNM